MIWLVGGAGMLGSEVERLLRERSIKHVTSDLEVDITSERKVLDHAKACRPDWIINCAAYTAVDKAEEDEERAYAVNATGALNLALAADAVGASLIHVSTDYVFDGSRGDPYPEDAPSSPLGAYGRTKEAGEALIRANCPRHFIVRTAWLHGAEGPNFVATMLRLMAERPSLRVVSDQRGSPTYAADLAACLVAIAEQRPHAFGTFHFVNQGACTWHEFAAEIQRQGLTMGLLDGEIPIKAIPSSAYPTPARRPANSVLAADLLRSLLGLSIPTWQDGLARHLLRLKEREN